jgi:two-component system OmpR family response regulator
MSRKILVIEDDAVMCSYLEQVLSESGFSVDLCRDGQEGLRKAGTGRYDAIILDRMLPELDGLSLLQSLRAGGVNTPVLMLSALGSVDERVKGLRAGSDDYLAKPFAMSELIARLEAILRRASADAAAQVRLSCGELDMDLLTRRVSRAGKPIDMQPREFRLLEFLMRHQNQVVTRTMLLEGVWDYYFDPQTNVIDVHISRLRQKIDKGFPNPLIHTVRGVGYMLSASR